MRPVDCQLDVTKPMTEMVSRSLPNINRTFFLVIDQKYGNGKPWLVWAGSRDDAVECVEIVARFAGPRT